MKTELLQLIRETKACLTLEFKKGELFEAGFLRLSPDKPQSPTTLAPIPPPTPLPAPREEIARPKPKMAPPEQKKEAEPHTPALKKNRSAEMKESNEMLSFLKEKLPHLPLLDPPTDFIDFCFLYEAEEEELVQKIREALARAKIQSTLLKASQWTHHSPHSSYKAFVATKKRIQESSHLHALAGRKQDGQPHIAGTPLLIMPDLQALESPEIKRAFWNALLQAADS